MASNNNNNNEKDVVDDLIDLGEDEPAPASASASTTALLGEFSADMAELSIGDVDIGGEGDDDDDDIDDGDALYGGLLSPRASSSATTIRRTPPRVETLEAEKSTLMDVDAATLPPIEVSTPTPQPPAPADGGAAANADANNGVIVVSKPVRISCKLYFVYNLSKFIFN